MPVSGRPTKFPLLKITQGDGPWEFYFQPLAQLPRTIDWVFEDVSDEKKTAKGTGFFLTWLITYTDQNGDVLGRQRFRVLRFRPAS